MQREFVEWVIDLTNHIELILLLIPKSSKNISLKTHSFDALIQNLRQYLVCKNLSYLHFLFVFCEKSFCFKFSNLENMFGIRPV